jgi:competence protein ComEA
MCFLHERRKNMKAWVIGFLAACCFAGSALAAVNINTASEQQLQELKGIGPAKAKAIIEYRQKHGPFKSVDELDKVKGIGKGVLDGVRSQASVSGFAAAPPASAAPAAPVAAKPTSSVAVTKPLDPKTQPAKKQ